MKDMAWLIVWLPLLGFFFNAFLGKRMGKTAVAYVAPGVVLAAFVVAVGVCLQLNSLPEHRAVVSLIPGLSPETPWINFGGFRVNFGLLIDPLSILMALIVTGVGGLIHVYATGYMADDPEQPRFFTYFNLFIFMMLLLVMGENFLLMFVGWEGVGSCSYLLISFWYTTTDNAKAGNKAFIVNRVGDLGFALGMILIWSVFGTLSFFTDKGTGVMQLAGAAHGPMNVAGYPVEATTITVICCLLFVGAIGKSAQIPLWVWLPDAMAGPTPVSALIHAATMVTAGVVMVTRCSWLFVHSTTALQFVGWIGLATAFVGATIGLVQNDIKRVLAFSTVSQLGYMFLACGVGNFTAGMFHVTTHAFFKALLFLGSGAVIHSMLGEQDMRKMGGLKKLIPRTYTVMFIGTYAIAGFPLMSGFWSKDEILDSAARSPWGSGMILYGLGLGIALMTAFYMNRLMWKTFYTDQRFVNGELPHQHHSNFDDEHDVQGHGDAHATPIESTLSDTQELSLDDAPHATSGDTQGLSMEAVHPTSGSTQELSTESAHGHGHGHGGSVHESPPSMMIPLYVLAFLSIAAGLALGPMTHAFEHFLEPSVAPLKLGGLTPGEEPSFLHAIPYAGYVFSSIIAILGLGIAASLYGKRRKTGDLIPAETKLQYQRNPLHPYTFLLNKWWWDALYDAIFIKMGGWFAESVLWKTVDAGMIDGFVNGLAASVGRFSSTVRRLQTGYVGNYALGMLVGVVLLVIGLIFTYNSIPK